MFGNTDGLGGPSDPDSHLPIDADSDAGLDTESTVSALQVARQARREERFAKEAAKAKAKATTPVTISTWYYTLAATTSAIAILLPWTRRLFSLPFASYPAIIILYCSCFFVTLERTYFMLYNIASLFVQWISLIVLLYWINIESISKDKLRVHRHNWPWHIAMQGLRTLYFLVPPCRAL